MACLCVIDHQHWGVAVELPALEVLAPAGTVRPAQANGIKPVELRPWWPLSVYGSSGRKNWSPLLSEEIDSPVVS